MDKNKDPAFLFYSSDFLTGTMFMSDEQVGKYIRLMCAQHQKGHLKEKDMLNICKTYDEDIYAKFVKDDEGNYYNIRLDKEITKRSKYSESRRNNRLSGLNQKEKKEEHMNNICKSYEQHMENENENENINKDLNKNEVNSSNKSNKPKKPKKPEEPKSVYGELLNVELTDNEHQKLIDEYGLDIALKAIEYLSAYKVEKGYTTKSDYLTIRRWVVNAVREKELKQPKAEKEDWNFMDFNLGGD